VLDILNGITEIIQLIHFNMTAYLHVTFILSININIIKTSNDYIY